MMFEILSQSLLFHGIGTEELEKMFGRISYSVKSVSYTHLTLPTIYSV